MAWPPFLEKSAWQSHRQFSGAIWFYGLKLAAVIMLSPAGSFVLAPIIPVFLDLGFPQTGGQSLENHIGWSFPEFLVYGHWNNLLQPR